ncbi:MAG: DegV family protein [Oscillospiraceae bacterium]|jgi:DegV family protein with EDD domain|nr:DegV family protein [Oscillospiraceae bacterium]
MITIVTDSSSYLKKSEAQEYGVRIVPINYSINGQNYSESFSDLNGDFEKLLKGSGTYSTSHPNLSAFLSCFEEELQKNNEVLCVTISSRLSGAYSTAYMAAKQTENENIAVFDSQLTAGGLYLLIKETRKLIEKGISLNEILKELPSVRGRIAIAFSVDDMTPLRNSGRIGFVRLSVGTFLNIKPILLCKDGAVVSDSIAHGNTEIIKKLIGKISKDTQEIVISYIGDNRLTSNLYHVISGLFPNVAITLQKIGPVLGIHLGLKAIAISFIS